MSLALFLASASFLFVAEAQATQGFPMYAWGGGTLRPTPPPTNVPGRVGDATNWVQSATAAGGLYAVNAEGHLYAWGHPWTAPRMGQGDNPNNPGTGTITEPTRIGTADNWVQVAGRQNNVAAINADGELFRWGDSNNAWNVQNVPTQVGSGTNWVYVAVGNEEVFAINEDGYLYAWGQNTFGILGLGLPAGATVVAETPQRVAGGPWATVSVGASFVLAVTESGELWSWGSNLSSQLGRPTAGPGAVPGNVPGRVGTAYDWVDARTTNSAAVALNSDGELWTWGNADNGQLGDGTTTNRGTPTQIAPGQTWVSIHGGNSHFLAFNSDYELWAWGNNASGQLGLGDGRLSSYSTPQFVIQSYGFSGAARGGGVRSLMLMHIEPVGADFTLTKHLQKPVGTPAPNLNFRFTFERNSFNDNTTPADIARIPVINPIILNPTTVVSPPPPPAGTIALEAYFDFLDGIVFTEVGTFSWIIREDATHPAGQGPDSEVVFSQAEYELRVYVANRPGIGGDLYIRFITLHRIQNADGTTPENGREKVNNLIFVNQYTYDPFITPTGLWLTGSSLYLVIFTTGVTLTAYLSFRARKRIEELPIMH